MFDEKPPESMGNAAEILAQLNQYGTPASVAQTRARFFGFVNGGVIPASLAARKQPVSGLLQARLVHRYLS